MVTLPTAAVSAAVRLVLPVPAKKPITTVITAAATMMYSNDTTPSWSLRSCFRASVVLM
nr:hypothetical protein BDOA9_0100270 [Bradyrhizobium sp. DOA9]